MWHTFALLLSVLFMSIAASTGIQSTELQTETLEGIVSGSTLLFTTTRMLVSNPETTLTSTTSTSSPLTLATSMSSSSYVYSLVQATKTEPGYSSASSGNAGDGGVNVAAGASGSNSGGFNLTTAGLIAIIIVVVVVVVIGVLSTTLYVIAKRRQWKVRESIKRASRRMAGRRHDRREATDAPSQRKGSPRAHQQCDVAKGHKRGIIVEVKQSDVETGRHLAERNNEKVGWKQRLMRNDWK